MKAFIIHTKDEKSKSYARKTFSSFRQKKRWKPIFFEGVELSNLHSWEKRLGFDHQKHSRAEMFFRKRREAYLSKKCCSFNHYRLAKKCISLGEDIAVIEHDSECIKDWDNPKFEDVLILNVKAAVQQFHWIKRKPRLEEGVSQWDSSFLGKMTGVRRKPLPGTAAYCISVKAATRLAVEYETKGWEQSDFIINGNTFSISYALPSYFQFHSKNLKTSWTGNAHQ